MNTPKYYIVLIFLVVLIAAGTIGFLYFVTPQIKTNLLSTSTPTQIQPKFSFESKDPKYQITVNNLKAITDLANKWSVFSSGNFNLIKVQFSSQPTNDSDIQIDAIFSIYSDFPANKNLVSSSVFKLPDQNKTLTYLIYISPNYTASPSAINIPFVSINNSNPIDNLNDILNYQLIYQMYWTGTIKNSAYGTPAPNSFQPWVETIQNQLQEWKNLPSKTPLILKRS